MPFTTYKNLASPPTTIPRNEKNNNENIDKEDFHTRRLYVNTTLNFRGGSMMARKIFQSITVISLVICISLISQSFYDAFAEKKEGTIAWTFTLDQGQICNNDLAICRDGTIIGVSTAIPGQGVAIVYALSPDGKKKWTFDLPDFWSSNPVIGSDNTIYIISGPFIIAIHPDGKKKWEIQPYNICSLAIGPDDVLYTYQCASGAYYRQIMAINPDGTTKWSVNSFTTSPASLTVGKTDEIYYSGNSDTFKGIVALNSNNGSEK